MKYRKETIIDDPFVLLNFTNKQVAKITGYSISYISLLRRGLRTASEEVYLDIQSKLKNYLTTV